MNQEHNKIEDFEGEFLHPSFDIKNGLLIFGFRYITKKLEEDEVFLIAKNDNLEIFSGDSFEFDGRQYFLDKRERKLERIENRWSIQEMKNFINDYNTGKIKISLIPQEIYRKIKELSKKYIGLEEVDYSLITAWAIGSYFFPIFSAYPFLHIKAPKRSGKSQCLSFLKQACFNAVKARPTLPALGDTVDSLRGTYLIDQADSLKRKGNEDLVDILADSYKIGGGKRRVVEFDKRGRRKVLEIETYGPKAFASIGELPEDLNDRCFIIPLIRSNKNFPEPDEESENWKEIRGMLYKFAISNYSFIENIYNVVKVNYRINPEIIGREMELWTPLETIIKFCAEEELKKNKKRFLQLYGFTEYEPSEFEEEVVETIIRLFNEREIEKILSPKSISEEMDNEVFLATDTPQQKSAKVGWAIRKFHLASEKKPRTRDGVSYLFKKENIENIYKAYFKSKNESTSPTSPQENELKFRDVGI